MAPHKVDMMQAMADGVAAIKQKKLAVAAADKKAAPPAPKEKTPPAYKEKTPSSSS